MTVARRFPYLVALIAAVTAAAVRYALSHVLHDDVPYLTFFAAVMTAAWYGGFREGLAATVFSGAAAVLLFVNPSWLEADPHNFGSWRPRRRLATSIKCPTRSRPQNPQRRRLSGPIS